MDQVKNNFFLNQVKNNFFLVKNECFQYMKMHVNAGTAPIGV